MPEMHSAAYFMVVCSSALAHCNPGAVTNTNCCSADVTGFTFLSEKKTSLQCMDLELPLTRRTPSLGRIWVLYPRFHGSSAGGLGSTPWLSHSGESLRAGK